MAIFAIINRRIPPKRVNLYVTLFFLGTGTMAIADLPGKMSSSLNFLFVFFPVSSLDAFTNQNSVVAGGSVVERSGGLGFLGFGVFCLMLARYGLRGVLDTTKPWRFVAFCFFVVIGLMSGFRSVLVLVVMTFALLFYLERLHHTRLLLPVILVSLAGGVLMLLFATRLPLSFQRSLEVLPFVQIDPLARMSAEASSEWRVKMWQEVLPEIPRYLVIGKGYAFSGTELGQTSRGTAWHPPNWRATITMALCLSLSPSGFLARLPSSGFWPRASACFIRITSSVIPPFINVNIFLFAYFVVKVIFFFTVFGWFNSDLPMFLGLLGLSISLNGGVAKPVVAPRPKVVFNRFRLHPSARPPVGV